MRIASLEKNLIVKKIHQIINNFFILALLASGVAVLSVWIKVHVRKDIVDIVIVMNTLCRSRSRCLVA